VERADLLLASAKILVIGHADLLPIRSLALDPVVGPTVRYVDHVIRKTLPLKPFRGCVLFPEVTTLSQPEKQSGARWHACVAADFPQR